MHPLSKKRVIFNKAPVRESMRKFTFEIEEEEAQPLHELHRNEVMDCRFRRGAVVQLVRIPACHAVGREFESRPHRRNDGVHLDSVVFVYADRRELIGAPENS